MFLSYEIKTYYYYYYYYYYYKSIKELCKAKPKQFRILFSTRLKTALNGRDSEQSEQKCFVLSLFLTIQEQRA